MVSSPSQSAAQRRNPATLPTRLLLSAVLVTFTSTAVPTAEQEAPAPTPATLIYGIVRVEAKRIGEPTPGLQWHFMDVPVIVENVDTRQTWEVMAERGEDAGYAVFRLSGLNPGRYRIVVVGPNTEVRVVWSGEIEKIHLHDYTARVVLQEYRPIFIDAVLRWIVPESSPPPEARGVTPPLTETCRADRSTPLDGTEDWWGELWGVLRTPDGKNAPAGLRVNIEALGAPEVADPFITQTRTTETGCYGMFGLMPGRYRVFVDEPPFVFQAEIQVPARGSGGATRRDGELATPPERAAGQPLRPSWYSRLRHYHSYWPEFLVDAVQLAELDTDINNPDDLAHLNGAVIWQNEPNDWRQYYRVPGVSIIFEHERTKHQYTVTTDADGSFDLYVPQGRYRMQVAHPPFTTARARILALPEGFVVREGFKTARGSGVYAPRAARRSGLMTGINIGLVMPIDERTGIQTKMLDTDSFVSVAADAPPDIAGPLAPTFTTRDIERPLIGGRARTLQSLFPLVPGVVVTESLGSLAQYTSVGQRRFSNRLTIDGISADVGVDVRGPGIGIAGSEALPALATSGGTETLVPASAIDEIRVRTTNATPQYAQTPGAQTSIITRAGGDTSAGGLFVQTRPRALGARDPFKLDSRPPLSENYGASVGGPIAPGRLRYFAAWEALRVDRSVAAVAEVPSLALRETATPDLQPLLAAFPQPNGPDIGVGLAELRQEFPATSALNVVSVRVDGNLSRHHAFGRVSIGQSRGTALIDTVAVQLPDLTFDRQELTSTRTGTFGVLSSLSRSGRWLNDLRSGGIVHRGGVIAGAASFGEAAPLDVSGLIGGVPVDDASVSVVLSPGPHGTIRSGQLSDTRQSQFQVSNTLTYAAGRNEWKSGIELTRVTAGTAGASHYAYSFAPDLRLRQITISEAAPARALFPTLALFLQDTLRLSNRLTLNVGARYSVKPAPVSRTDLTPVLMQFEALPLSVLPRPADQPLWKTGVLDGLAPQAGAVYELGRTPGRSTMLRGGWSLTHDELTSPGAVAFGRGAPYVSRRVIRPSKFPVPAAELAAPGTQGPTEYFAFPESLKRPRTYGWFASFDQELGRTQRVTLSYVGTAGRDLIYWYAYNAGSPASINVYTNDGRSDYDALFVQYARRLAAGFEAQAVYTWSRAQDNDSGERQTPHLPPALSAPAAERGPADFDRPHVLTLTGGYRLPSLGGARLLNVIGSNWQFDAAAVLRSGAPFSVTIPRDFGGGSVYTVRTDSSEGPDWLADLEGRVLNVLAFPVSAEKRQGTRGRNELRAAPLRQLDLALSRTVRLSRRTVATFRAEAFNVFGTVNYGPPESRRLHQNFGRPYQTAAQALGTGTLSDGGLVPLQQIGGPRAIQLTGRLGW